jgi:hypothetical protein
VLFDAVSILLPEFFCWASSSGCQNQKTTHQEPSSPSAAVGPMYCTLAGAAGSISFASHSGNNYLQGINFIYLGKKYSRYERITPSKTSSRFSIFVIQYPD